MPVNSIIDVKPSRLRLYQFYTKLGFGEARGAERGGLSGVVPDYGRGWQKIHSTSWTDEYEMPMFEQYYMNMAMEESKYDGRGISGGDAFRMKTYRQLFEGRVGQKTVEKKPDTPERKAIRAPGDVGKVDRLTQMYKDAPETTTVPDTAQRFASAVKNPGLAAKADEVLKGLGYKGGDKVGEVKARKDFRDPYQYRRAVKKLGKDQLGIETDADEKLEADPEGTKLPKGRSKKEIEAGMERAQKSGQLAGRDATTSADETMDQVVQDAESPTVRDPLRVKTKDGENDVEVKGTADLRHGYQGSGVGVMDKTEFDDEYQNALIGAILDPDMAALGKKERGKKQEPDSANAALGIRNDLDQQTFPPIQQKSAKSGDVSDKVQDPTARDVETHSTTGELRGIGAGKAYLTKDVIARQKELRDALVGQQSDKVQDLAFKFKDISDEQLDGFIDTIWSK